jgi:hypothetical protein
MKGNVMREDLLVQRMREAALEWAKLPPEGRFRRMVERGIIDEKGNVIVRMPEPPRKKTKRKGKGRSDNSQDK